MTAASLRLMADMKAIRTEPPEASQGGGLMQAVVAWWARMPPCRELQAPGSTSRRLACSLGCCGS